MYRAQAEIEADLEIYLDSHSPSLRYGKVFSFVAIMSGKPQRQNYI